MDKAALQAAADADTEDVAKALEVVRLRWEPDYLTGWENEHGWWASRRGVIGHILTADNPEELGQMIDNDFGTATSPPDNGDDDTPKHGGGRRPPPQKSLVRPDPTAVPS